MSIVGSTYVRQTIAGFMNTLVSFGVAGFRFDASKHMWPGDLKIIADMLNDLPTSKGFPAGSRPLIYQEVIDQGIKSLHTHTHSHTISIIITIIFYFAF